MSSGSGTLNSLDEVIDQYRQMHRKGHFGGFGLFAHVDQINALINETHARTLLDYGSGRGKAWRRAPINAETTLYDPAVEQYANKPAGPFDGVVCLDVLEHIPEDHVKSIIEDIFGYARKFVYLTICTRLADKKLPDGRNCHLTVKPREWWLDLIGQRDVKVGIEWSE